MPRLIFDSATRTLCCAFSGRIEAEQCAEIETMLEDAWKNPAGAGAGGPVQVVFDLARVEFITSCFLRICLATAKTAGSGRFAVRNCQPFVFKVFSVTDLTGVFPVS